MSEEKSADDEAMKGLEKAASAILGLLALSEERAKRMFEELVEKGAQVREDRSSVITRIIDEAEKEKETVVKKAREELNKGLSHLNLATKDDIARLERLINEKLK